MAGLSQVERFFLFHEDLLSTAQGRMSLGHHGSLGKVYVMSTIDEMGEPRLELGTSRM